jgi:hypothetical protein
MKCFQIALASLALAGAALPDGTNYCISTPNLASATGAQISLAGTCSVSANDFTLTFGPILPGERTLFISGPTALLLPTPFGSGLLCIAWPVTAHWPVGAANGAGFFSRSFDLTAMSTALPGMTVNFQGLYTDPNGPPLVRNTSDALHVTFTP